MKPEELPGKLLDIQTADNWSLKANQFSPPAPVRPKSVLLILPAMGSHARPYRFMASALAKSGHVVLTLDPRGHGQSLPHPKRGVDYGFDDILHHDFPAALDYISAQFPDLPIFLMGHSAGGHLSCAYAAENPGKIRGIITLTTPHLHFPKLAYPSILLFSFFVLMAKILGYVPGQHVGWGSPLARQHVLDWSRWGFGGTFRGTDGRSFEPALKNLETDNLCIGFTDDKRLARPTSVQHFADLLPADKTTVWCFAPEELDVKALDHFNHLRTGTKLWPRISNWISDKI